MKIGKETLPRTAISTSDEHAIVVRGLDLSQDLIGKLSFTDYFHLLLTGRPPTPAASAVIDATLVAIAEHGLVPSVQASRMTLAAAPEALQGAVAAGVLGCGSVILGSAEAAGRFLTEVCQKEDGGVVADEAVGEVVRAYRAERRAIPGYGHPLHKGFDPRARRLFEIAAEIGCAGRHIAAAQRAERLLPSLVGKPLSLNVSGAIPAVLLDAGFPLGALKGIPILARTASLIAHLLEEQARPIGFVLSHAGSEAIGYDGPSPDGFRRSEG